MVQLALRLFALSAGLLQLLVAALLVRRGAGPFRALAAAGLVLNGAAALRLATAGAAPFDSRLVDFADGATGPVLLGCAALVLRFPRHDLRDRRGWTVAAAVAVAAAVLGAVVLGAATPAHHPLYDWLHTFSALLGLALLGVWLAWTLRHARADQAQEAGLLALAFLATLAENAVAALDQLLWTGVLHERAGRSLGHAVAILGALVTIALLAWPARRNRGWRAAVLLAMASGAAAYLSYFNRVGANVEPVFFVLYLGTTLSFYVLRPIALGLAYARSRTLWGLHDLAWFVLLLVLGKALALPLLGSPFTAFRFQDLSVIAAVMLLLPVAMAATRRILGVRESRRDEPAAHERLGRYLLDMHHREGPGWSASKLDIELVTGITENNLAAAIRRLERGLDERAAPGTLVLEQRVGVRGRKRYRLSPAAVAALDAS